MPCKTARAQQHADQVAEYLEQFVANYQALQAQRRYAFVAKGIELDWREGQLQEKKNCIVQVRDQDRTLLARTGGMWGWDMKFTDGEKIHIRDMPFDNVPTWKFANQEEFEKQTSRRGPTSFHPLSSMFSFGTDRVGPNLFSIKGCQLDETRIDDAGNLFATFSIDQPRLRRIDVLFGRSVDFMPVDFKLYLAVRQDEPIPVVHKRILWKRNNQIMTPVVIRITSRVLSRLEISESVKLSLRWKFEDELGDAPLLDPARPDWREPVRVLFETEWRRSTPKEKKTAG